MDNFPDFLEEDFVKHSAKSKAKLHYIQKEGELAAVIEHKHYKGAYDSATGQTPKIIVCPPTIMLPKKDNPKLSYPKRIEIIAEIVSMTPIDGICELTDDGRFKVLAEVNYNSKNVDETSFVKWVNDNAAKLYDENDTTLNETLRGQMKNYIAPTGEITDKTYVKLSPNSNITVKCKDDKDESSIFRQKLEGTDVFAVHESTKLNITNVKVVAFIYMAKQPNDKGIIEYTPRVAYSLQPGKVSLAPGEEVYKGAAAKMRENRNPDQHLMVYPPAELDHTLKAATSGYFRVENRYSTNAPADIGVSIRIDDAQKPEDVVYTTNDGEKVKTVNRDLLVYQWKGNPLDGIEKFRVELRGGKNGSKFAEKFGILNTEEYGLIMFAHFDVTFHAMVTLWWNATFKNKPANHADALAKDESGIRGYYTYGITNLIPDYYLYFEKKYGALQISKEMCGELFDDFVGTVKKTGATQLTLRSMEPLNPVNADGIQSEVILLGRPDYHIFNGDVWPLVKKSRIYVMTSYKISDQERISLCGANADTDAADARFKELLTIPGFTYLVFLVQIQEENDKDLATVTPMDEDPVEESPQEMSSSSSEEPAPTPKRKAIAKKKTITRKKRTKKE